MRGNKAALTQTNDYKAPVIKREGTTFAPKAKGAILNNVPTIDPALKSLAYNRRKKTRIG